MERYQIKVVYENIFFIEAESEDEARLMAEEKAMDEMITAGEEQIEHGYSAMRHLFNTHVHGN